MTEVLTSPGWVDIHTHLAGFSRGGIDVDGYGVEQGVATVVDAGSAPPDELPRLLADSGRCATCVLAWANICAEGIAGKDCAGHDISGAAADRALREAPGRVIGIKLQASNTRLAHRGLEAIANARRVAERHGVPLLVHVGNGPPTMREVAAALRPGDIITHFAHGKPCGALEDGRVHPSLLDARRRGVLFDVGHGAGSFSFDVMETLLEQDFPPDIISTDLHAGSADAPVRSLADCMSKLLGLGMDVESVVGAVTTVPTASLRRQQDQRRTRYRLAEQEWLATDSYGGTRTLRRRFEPIEVVQP
jgi:dihydroorotase